MGFSQNVNVTAVSAIKYVVVVVVDDDDDDDDVCVAVVVVAIVVIVIIVITKYLPEKIKFWTVARVSQNRDTFKENQEISRDLYWKPKLVLICVQVL